VVSSATKSGATITRGVFIALGSNLGDRAGMIDAALRMLGEGGAVSIVRRSTLHETEPVGGPAGQGRYLNAAAELETGLSPRELLALCHDIERRLGRVRVEHDGPRTIDLDILLYGDQRIDEPGLTVPHPRMWQREFVLGPLREIASEPLLAAARERCVGGL